MTASTYDSKKIVKAMYVARVCKGAGVAPQGDIKIFLGNFVGRGAEFGEVHPQVTQKMGLGAAVDTYMTCKRVINAKRSSDFWGRMECTPAGKILAMPMVKAQSFELFR